MTDLIATASRVTAEIEDEWRTATWNHAGPRISLTAEAALHRVQEHARRLESEKVPLLDGLDRYLSHGIVAPCEFPPADNSAMDGYAVRARDIAIASMDEPATLRLLGVQPAGRPATLVVGPGEAVAVGTGAVLPPGADTVVVKEDVDLLRESPVTGGPVGYILCVRVSVAAGVNIRRAGEEYQTGEVLLAGGTHLSPAAIGLLATAGLTEVQVLARPRVANPHHRR